jgi:hypothetical protein
LPAYRYKDGSWKREDRQEIEGKGTLKKNLRVLSWNVWMDEFNRDERFKVITYMLEHSQADIICL